MLLSFLTEFRFQILNEVIQFFLVKECGLWLRLRNVCFDTIVPLFILHYQGHLHVVEK